MDTLVFGLLLVAAGAVYKASSRSVILWLFLAGLLTMLFVFGYHATDPLALNF